MDLQIFNSCPNFARPDETYLYIILKDHNIGELYRRVYLVSDVKSSRVIVIQLDIVIQEIV